MAVSASRGVHFISAAFQYFAIYQTGGLSINCICVRSVFPVGHFMPPNHIICGVVYGINIFCVYQSFIDIRVSRGAYRSLFDIRVSHKACCSLFDIRVSRGACCSLFDIRVSREACHSLFIHTGETKSTRPRRGCPKPAAFHDARLQSLLQGRAQDRNAACRNVRCLRGRTLKDTLLAVVGDARPSVGDTKAELLPPEARRRAGMSDTDRDSVTLPPEGV